MRRVLLVLACLLSVSCALPVADPDHQTFVPDRDLTVVSMAREGLAYYQKSRFVDAEFSFRQALYLYPSAANIKSNLAAALRATGQFDEAEDILLSLNAASPKSLEYIGSLARLYLEKADFPNARKYFSQAYEIALEKGDFAAASRYARSLSAISFRVGDEAEALCYSMLANSLELNAENIGRHGRLLIALHKSDKAEVLLKTYLNQPGVVRDTMVMHELAMAYFARGDYKEAVESERSVLEAVDLDKSIQSESKLVAALSRQHVLAANPSPADAEVEDETAPDILTTQIDAALAAAPDNSSLYWPLSLLEQVAEIEGKREISGGPTS